MNIDYSYYFSVEIQVKERLLKSCASLFDLSNYNNIHLICVVVKDFLRLLSESLLTDAQWKYFASIIEVDSYSIKQQKFELLIQQLPKSNCDTLAFIILHAVTCCCIIALSNVCS